MLLQTLLRSEATAWVVGAVGLAVGATFAFSWFGWLGIGLVGLIGLLITTRVALTGDHPVMDSRSVGLLIKQLEVRNANSSPEQKAAAEAERAMRAHRLYAVNTAFIGMAALGFGLFFLHQV